MATKGKPKRETESLLIAGQNNAKGTTYVKARTDKTQQNSKYHIDCVVSITTYMVIKEDTINHISE